MKVETMHGTKLRCRAGALAVAFVLWLCPNNLMAVDDIHEAARKNDLARVKELVDGDAECLTAKDSDRQTVLHVAVGNADAELVAYLVAKGADVNAVCCVNRFTPLHLTHDPAIASLLIKNGADWNAKSAFGTVLDQAISDNNMPIIDLLLQAGATLDIEALAKLGKTKRVAARLKEKPWLAKAPRQALHYACSGGHLEVATMLLDNGADPNQDFGFSNVAGLYTPFSSAVTSRHFELAKLLCQRGARMDVAGGKNHDSLFHYVVMSERFGARWVRMMLDHGADVRIVSKHWGMTPLHVAAERNQVDKAKVLLEFGADPNATSHDGVTPLTIAAVANHEPMARLLVDHNARIDLHTACAFGWKEDVQRLLSADPKAVHKKDDRLHRTPLFWAVRHGDVSLVRLLVDSGADVNVKVPEYSFTSNVATGPSIRDDGRDTAKGETPLHLAAQLGSTQIAALLLDKGAELEPLDDSDCVPLQRAVQYNRVANVRLLISKGASVSGSTLSAAYDNLEVTRILLTARPSQQAISSAISIASPQVAEVLLQAGAEADVYSAARLGLAERLQEIVHGNPKLLDLPQKDYPRQRPLALAARGGHLEAVRVLIDHGAALDTAGDDPALVVAASSGSVPLLRFLLERGATIDRKNSSGDTPLIEAARRGHAEAVTFLLSAGANLRLTGRSRDSALHAAASAGEAEIVRLLLDRGIPVTAANQHGQTPLHDAAYSGDVATVTLLLQHGADINARTHRGETPLRFATREFFFQFDEVDRTNVTKLLRQRGAK